MLFIIRSAYLKLSVSPWVGGQHFLSSFAWPFTLNNIGKKFSVKY